MDPVPWANPTIMTVLTTIIRDCPVEFTKLALTAICFIVGCFFRVVASNFSCLSDILICMRVPITLLLNGQSSGKLSKLLDINGVSVKTSILVSDYIVGKSVDIFMKDLPFTNTVETLRWLLVSKRKV
jgi:hypothetical protein